MKVLVIATNQERSPMVTMPVGAAHVAGAARHHGHEVELLDLYWEDDPVAVVRERVRRFAPEAVGISMRNVDNTDMVLSITYLEPNKAVVDAVKSETNAPIVMGGCGFTIFAKQLVRYMDISFGVAGEGEVAFPTLLDCLATGKDPAGVPGVVYRRGDEVVANPFEYLPDVDDLPEPAFDLLNPQPYVAKGGPLGIEGRRGCPLGCIYCAEKGAAGFRLRRASKVVDQIERLVTENGITNFTFTDGVVNFPYDYGMEVFQGIVDRDLKIMWGAMVNPYGVDREMARLMKRSGCGAVSVGLDAASTTMLDNYAKGFTKEDIVTAAKHFTEAGVFQINTMMFGGPGETMETIQESIDLLLTLPPGVVYMCLGVRVYPGTELTPIAEREGFIEPGEDLTVPKFYVSRALDPVVASAKLVEVCQGRPMWSTATILAEKLG